MGLGGSFSQYNQYLLVIYQDCCKNSITNSFSAATAFPYFAEMTEEFPCLTQKNS